MQTNLNPGNGEPAHDWRADVAGLRGLSVLLVLAYHLQLRGAGGGFIGVDVFFVISGYLMTRIVWRGLERDSFRYWGYLGARAARILPALGAMLALLLLAGARWLPPFDLKLLAEQALRSVLFWSNQYYLDHSGYNTQSADTNWLLHTWSLSVEWQFYLLYPLVLWTLARLGAGRRLVLVALTGLLLLSLACFGLWSLSRPGHAFFLLPARAWELLAGGVAFLAAPAPGSDHRRFRWTAHLGVALVLASALWFAWSRWPAVGVGWPLVLPVAGAALVMWARDAEHPLLRLGPLQAVGRWSYSIYLWHWPLIVGLRMTDAFLDHPHLAAAGVAAASIALGALSYRLAESIRGEGLRRLRKPAVAWASAAALAGLLWTTGGLASRAAGAPSYDDYQASVRAAYYPERCSNFMKTAEQTKVCAVDKGTARRILVIGDSHAEQLYPWFAAHGQATVDFFTQAECPPVPNFDRMQNGFHCGDYAKAAWQKATSRDYDTLVLAAYWPNIGSPQSAPYCHVTAGSSCQAVNGADKQMLVRTELKAAIEALITQGKAVVMLAPTPEARVRVPERIERERFWFGEVRLSIDERTVTEKSGWMEPLLEALRGVKGFHLVSLNDRLCSGGACKVYDAELKRPVFIDENHFDPVWIARHGSVLAPFAQAGPTPP